MTKSLLMFCLVLLMVPHDALAACDCLDESRCPRSYAGLDPESCMRDCGSCYWNAGADGHVEKSPAFLAPIMVVAQRTSTNLIEEVDVSPPLIIGLMFGGFIIFLISIKLCCPDRVKNASAIQARYAANPSGYQPLNEEWKRNKWADEQWVKDKKKEGWDDNRIAEYLDKRQEYREDERDRQRYWAGGDTRSQADAHLGIEQSKRDKWNDEDFARDKKKEGWDEQKINDYVEKRQERREDRREGFWRADDYYGSKGGGKGGGKW